MIDNGGNKKKIIHIHAMYIFNANALLIAHLRCP